MGTVLKALRTSKNTTATSKFLSTALHQSSITCTKAEAVERDIINPHCLVEIGACCLRWSCNRTFTCFSRILLTVGRTEIDW